MTIIISVIIIIELSSPMLLSIFAIGTHCLKHLIMKTNFSILLRKGTIRERWVDERRKKEND